MFARVFALLPLALLASASHLEARDTCSTGSINCCNSVQTVILVTRCRVIADLFPVAIIVQERAGLPH